MSIWQWSGGSRSGSDQHQLDITPFQFWLLHFTLASHRARFFPSQLRGNDPFNVDQFTLYARQIPAGDSVKILLQRAAVFMISAFVVWNIDNLMWKRCVVGDQSIFPPSSARCSNSTLGGTFLQWFPDTFLVAVTVAWCKTNAAAQLKRRRLLGSWILIVMEFFLGFILKIAIKTI